MNENLIVKWNKTHNSLLFKWTSGHAFCLHLKFDQRLKLFINVQNELVNGKICLKRPLTGIINQCKQEHDMGLVDITENNKTLYRAYNSTTDIQIYVDHLKYMT